MSVRIIDNTLRITTDTTRNASLGLRLIAEAIVNESTPNTPQDKGNLRRDVIKQVLGLHGTIEWRKVYAQIQEKKQFANYTTGGTGPHFAENAVRKISKDADKYFRQAGLVR